MCISYYFYIKIESYTGYVISPLWLYTRYYYTCTDVGIPIIYPYVYIHYRLGLPSLGMMWAEWGGLEIHALLAGWLGTAYLGAQVSTFYQGVYMHYCYYW